MQIVAITAPNPSAFTLEGTQTYILDGVVVIDPGPEIESHIDAIVAAAPSLCAIVVTHRHLDHAPAARAVKQRTGAIVYAPPNALPPELVDSVLQDGELVRCGGVTLRAVATPGHTAEHFCSLGAHGELFTGDTVLGSGTTVIFPPDGDMSDYLATLERLITLHPAAIYPGHGPVRHDAVALLQEYLTHRLMRENQIVEALTEPTSIPQLRERIYRDLDPRLVDAAELQIEAHLISLVQQRRVRHDADRYQRV